MLKFSSRFPPNENITLYFTPDFRISQEKKQRIKGKTEKNYRNYTKILALQRK
jgi:hypothetical protein